VSLQRNAPAPGATPATSAGATTAAPPPEGGGKVLLARRGEEPWIESPLTDRADPERFDQLIDALTALSAVDFLDTPPGPPATLGLEPPQGVIEVVRKGQSAPFRLELGATRGAGFEEIEPEPFDLIINATAASLSGEIPPLPEAALGPQTVCYDLAYGRTALAFVRWAQQRGCARAVQGLGMLVEQAAESFRLWRGLRPPTGEVLAALRARVGG